VTPVIHRHDVPRGLEYLGRFPHVVAPELIAGGNKVSKKPDWFYSIFGSYGIIQEICKKIMWSKSFLKF
jgi:hypothetical protein